MTRLISILLFLSFLMLGFAQDSTLIFKGKIVSGSSALYNVTVKNMSTMSGTVTNYTGDFEIKAKAGDHFLFSSIGYKSVKYTIPDSISSKHYRVMINMVRDTVYLKEAVVVPWPQNTTMLKEAMLNKRKEKESIAPYAGFRRIEGDPKESESTIMNPLSFLYNKLNKKARQQKKIEKYRKIIQDESFDENKY